MMQISKLVMYFTMNATFVNYLDQFTNMTESLKIPIIRYKTTLEQTLPISLNVSKFDPDLLRAPRNLKDLIHQYNSRNKIFDLNERHDTIIELTTNKNFFSNKLHSRCLSVHYCDNLSSGYNFCNISIVQT